MKGRGVLVGVALLGVVALVGLEAGDAWARAGGGGSRGSRSSSPPVRPSPMMPSAPAAPAPSRPGPAMSQPAPSRPGWGGGLLGGLGGFLVGGLLGSVLFGGLAHGGGVGMLDLVLVAGGVMLLVMWLRRRQGASEPAYAGAPSRYVETSGWTAPTSGNARAGGSTTLETAPEQQPPAAEADLERGIAHIRQMDGRFDPAAVADLARTLFGAVQRAVTSRDLAAVRGGLTAEMLAALQGQCDELRGARRVNHVESIDIRQAVVSEAWQESGRDYVTVSLVGSLVDYTTDEGSGAVVAGARASQTFEEYWTFTRAVGPNAWTLSAIQAA